MPERESDRLSRVPVPVRALLAAVVVAGLVVLLVVLLVVRSRGPEGPRDSVEGVPPPALSAIAPREASDAVGALDAPVVQADFAREEATQAEGPLEVRVLTRDKLLSGANAVPRIRVVVGVGTPPLGAARGKIRAGLPVNATDSTLHEVTTDDTGSASVPISRSELDAGLRKLDGTVWARVVEPGYQQRTRLKPASEARGTSLEFVLLAFPGRTLRGQVVDEVGKPLAAEVGARAFDFEGKLGTPALGWAGDDGWFEVFPFRAGVQHLIADAGEWGTGALRDLNLDAPLSETIVVTVSGPGALRGRVLDAGGRPIPGLDLAVWLATFDDEEGSFRLPEPAHSFAMLEGGGRTWVTLTTDAQGAFEARGLRRDRYVIRAGSNKNGPYPHRLTPDPVQSDGIPLQLQLERTVLAVRIVDEQGERWKGTVGMGDVSDRFRGGERARITDRWPADTTIIVQPVSGSAEPNGRESPRHAGSVDGEGVFVVPVVAGTRYRVGLIGGFQPWKPVDVEVPAFAGRTEVVVTATSVDARGLLSVRVVAGNGEALNGGYSIRIEDVAEGATLLFDDLRVNQGTPHEFKLPESRYRVVVRGEPFIEFHHGTLVGGSANGRFETLVDVSRDSTTRIDATLPAGARIRLSIAGEVLDEDREAVYAAHPGSTFGGPIEFWAGRAATTLVTADRWPIPVPFPYELTGSSAAGTHLGDWLALGSEGTSELLPAGRYRIEARLPGGRSTSAEVTLVDGQTTTVTLAIEARTQTTPK